MIRAISIAFLLFCSISLHGQEVNQLDEQGKKQGPWIVKYSNDMVRYEGQFESGVPVGEFKHYTVEGPLKSSMVYSENGTKAQATHWYSNKKPLAVGVYINEKKEGLWTFYSDQGVKTSEEMWVAGVQTGPQIVYHANGKIARKCDMVDGVEVGPMKKYFDSGQLQEEGEMVNGLLEGTVTRYHPNGMVHSRGKYLNGKRNGKWTHYYDNGNIAETITWQNGVQQEAVKKSEFDN